MTATRLTIQELQRVLTLHEPKKLTVNAGHLQSVLGAGQVALLKKPQVFDFGRIGQIEGDRKLAAELWHRKLLRPPFPTCIMTFIPRDTRITMIVMDGATIGANEGSEIHDVCAAILLSQPSDQVARVDAFAWFRCVDAEHIEAGATAITDCEGESDESFERYTMGCAAKIMQLSMLLNTKGIKQRHEPTPVKLNQKRAKSGKPPLDAVTYVDLHHVSSGSHSTGSHGHEKSMHLRRGHIRHFDDGSVSWVRDTVVKADGVLKERVRYQVR